MPKKRFKDVDRGYRRILRSMGATRSAKVYVGVRQGKTTEDGQSLALVAAANEFGTADGRIPERSFLRSTVEENRRRYGDILRDSVIKVAVLGVSTVDRELNRLGARAAGDVQEKIRSIDTPPNAPSTIARKGTDNPLIETGRLRQSIDWEVEEGKK